jgi:hypothetical protein
MVSAVLLLHVDELVGLSGHSEQRLFHRFGATQHLGRQAVKVRIGLVTDELHAVASPQLVHDRLDDVWTGAVTHVGI